MENTMRTLPGTQKDMVTGWKQWEFRWQIGRTENFKEQKILVLTVIKSIMVKKNYWAEKCIEYVHYNSDHVFVFFEKNK